jgi:hypothetical protein
MRVISNHVFVADLVRNVQGIAIIVTSLRKKLVFLFASYPSTMICLTPFETVAMVAVVFSAMMLFE